MDEQALERAAREQGWQTGRTRKGHRRWVPPDPSMPIVIGSGTPGDHRAMRNFLAQLRRSGFIWPWPACQEREEHHDGVER
jgi:hypothetical protein